MTRPHSGGTRLEDRQRLSVFIAAANELLNTPLARRTDLATMGTRLDVTFDGHGQSRIYHERPPVEEIELAAMRLRPFVLGESEVVYLSSVLKALGRCVIDDVQPLVKGLRKQWQSFPNHHYFSANGTRLDAPEDGDSVPLLRDREIAVDWLYGHLMHTDLDRRHRIRNVGEEAKYMAGLLWAKDAIAFVTSTRNLIVWAEDEDKMR